jgi:hypothetical protein
MTASDAESMTMHDLLAMADNEDHQAWDQLRLGYTQTWGSPALRDTIAATYRGISADDILKSELLFSINEPLAISWIILINKVINDVVKAEVE